MTGRPIWLLIASVCCGCAALPQQDQADRRIAFDTQLLRGDIAIERQQLGPATDHYVQASLLSDDPAVAERATRMAHELGMTESGRIALDRWRELAPDDERVHYFSGVLEARSGRPDRATQDFIRLIDTLGDPGIAMALITDSLDNERDTQAAVQVLSALLRRYPDTLEGHYGLARFALRSGDFDMALRNAAAAATLGPDWVDAQLLYARTLLVAGRTTESLAIAERMAEQHDDLETRLQHAELLISAGRPQQARALLSDILQSNPGLPEATRALGYLALTQNDLTEASGYFNELRNEPRYRDEAFFYLGRIAETEGRFLQATRSYQRVTSGNHAVEAQLRTARVLLAEMEDGDGALRHLEEFGNANPRFYAELLIARGQILLHMERPEAAMALITEAVADNPDDESLHAVHARMHVILAHDSLDRRALDEAEATLNRGLALYPDDPSLRYSMALVYERQGRARRSVNLLRQLVAEYPDSPAYLNALGYVLTDGLNRHNEARGYIQQALAMDPDNAAIIDSMGWLLFRMGDAEAALDYLERAYRLEDEAEIAAHLIEVHWTLGNRELALELLDEAYERDPESPHLNDLNRRLRQ